MTGADSKSPRRAMRRSTTRMALVPRARNGFPFQGPRHIQGESGSVTETGATPIMSGPPPATIDLSTRQRALLEQIRQRHTAPQRSVRRVLVLLALATDPCLQTTAQDLRLSRISV